MKKNELVHLHALLAHVAADYRDRGVTTETDLEPYRAVGVGPSSLTEPRSEHLRAVQALLSALSGQVDADADDAERSDEASAATGNH